MTIGAYDRPAASAQRIRDCQARIKKMRNLADNVLAKPDLHRQTVATLHLLEDSLFELMQTHALLESLRSSDPVMLP